MLDVNLHFLGRGFLKYWDGELEQRVAEACPPILVTLAKLWLS